MRHAEREEHFAGDFFAILDDAQVQALPETTFKVNTMLTGHAARERLARRRRVSGCPPRRVPT
ncbi:MULTISPECIES: hypothetical protein [unclassified Streptomyces]|uniref:hypothetical protein n=1 Tax=unclassified Streptomyces TaxID=2593676 RepID=UPI00114C92A7|nr:MULTISPECIES: hypothetical protein [unclassified Streptomyces]MYZ36890.1 hypothetical protein [Streptomyces sp. SID4917]